MHPATQMRVGALLAILSIAMPFLASLLAGVLMSVGFEREALEPAFTAVVPITFLLFVAGVVLAAVGFIRRGRLPADAPDEP